MTQTVLVTGATGYIAKHIVVELLNHGHRVKGSMRSLARDAELRAAITPHLTDSSDLDTRLTTCVLDLSADSGWSEAMAGVDVVMHTASPFPMEQPSNEDDLIRPAVDGALRALKAAHAANISRVIMTSSTVAVTDSRLRDDQSAHDESNWTDLDHPGTTPYGKSKTLAERAAWDFVANDAPEMHLTTINPSLVLGPPLDDHYGTSIQIIERVLSGKDPMLPNFGFGIVDVRDIARMHVAAITTPESIGKRLIGSAGFMWFQDIALAIQTAYPERKTVTRVAPNVLMKALGLFDKAIKSILPQLGRRLNINASRAETMLDIEFRNTTQTVTDTATYLIENKGL